MAKMFPLLAALAVLAISLDVSASPIVVRYRDGTPRWTYNVVSGMPHGESVIFYPGGKPMVRGSYRQGVKHGFFTYFAPDGSKTETVLFLRGERHWRSSDKDAGPPPEFDPNGKGPSVANTGSLEAASIPYLPFAAMDRYSRRMGVMFGGSQEDGKLAGTRLEVFTNVVFGRYSLYASGSQSFIKGRRRGVFGEEYSYFQEQSTLHLAGSYHLATAFDTDLMVRGGYLFSVDSDPQDTEEVRGISGGQRPADFAATFLEAEVYRASATLVRRWRNFVGQVDLGLDLYSKEERGERVGGSLLRFNAAAGYFYGKHWQLMLESANSSNSNGPSLRTFGTTVNYLGGRLSWVSANVMTDQDDEYSFTLSVGTFLLRLD